ncbi:MAG: helix-turn-helix domain-containing protein [Magnetovibrio sp.]|nr:helix-turn-helix domain-containing protein [Magnetovibrio sp.]
MELNERCEIYRLHADGISHRRIASDLGRSPSTISRDLNRCTQHGKRLQTCFSRPHGHGSQRRGSKIERRS